MMDYRVEVLDVYGRRCALFDEVPLMDVSRTAPDKTDEIRGLLPTSVEDLGNAYEIRVWVDGRLFCRGEVDSISPQWGDMRKLILDQYVPFHNVVEFEAHGEARLGNSYVSQLYSNREVSAIVKDLINRAPGPVHYWVEHTGYPEGAQREFSKFWGRRTAGNALQIGGIDTGQWIDASRMDLSGAYAKDGDTIAGLVVDGVAWPDLRMMMIDTEEMALNSHARSRHPEVAMWDSIRYAQSGYAQKAIKAKAFLQQLIDEKSIEYIELNPHQNSSGVFDDRVDVYGRYLGLIYGGGECFNAALVEQDLADIYLWDEGRYHVPEMALKDFFSYTGIHTDSIENTESVLQEFSVNSGVLEALTALAYAAKGYVFSVDLEQGVKFHAPTHPDQVAFFSPTQMGVLWGARMSGMCNILYVDGNPLNGVVNSSYIRGESLDTYGAKARGLTYFALGSERDGEKLARGLLDDLAYPERVGTLRFFTGNAALQVGDLVEVRDGPLRRLDEALPEEWGGRFDSTLTGRVKEVRHRFSGKHVVTTAQLTSPLRSVDKPLSFMVRSQESASTLFEFRLDSEVVGLDMGFHLD